MTFRALVLLLLVSSFSGCNVQTGIAPTETVIKNASKRDFGFVDNWKPVSADFPLRVDDYTLNIDGVGNYKATLIDPNIALEDFVVNFRTHEISSNDSHAIVEIESKLGGRIFYRRLAIATIKNGKLHLWAIDNRKLGKVLFDSSATAVIEHFTFYSTVRCDSTILLNALSKNYKRVLGPVQVFERKSKQSR